MCIKVKSCKYDISQTISCRLDESSLWIETKTTVSSNYICEGIQFYLISLLCLFLLINIIGR